MDLFKKIIEKHNLKCSEQELDKFISEIQYVDFDYTVKFYSFNEKYNGKIINNIFDNSDCLYYVLNINGIEYLQPFQPFVKEKLPITEENKDEVIRNHYNKVCDKLNFELALSTAISHFK